MLNRWNILALALLTMAAIAFGACGGDDDDGAADGDSDGPTASRTSAGDDDDATPEGDDDAATPEGGDDDDEATATGNADDDDDESTPVGDDDDGPSPLTADETCELLTEPEVEEVLGSEVIQAVGAVGGCTFITEDYATLGLSLAELGDDPEEEFNLAGEFLDAEEVGGVGDDAFWLESLKQLQVRVGRTQIFLTLILVGDLDDPIDTASGLVQRVISRLD